MKILDISYFDSATKEWVGNRGVALNACLNLLVLNKNQLKLAPEGTNTYYYLQDSTLYNLSMYQQYLTQYYIELGYNISNILTNVTNTTLNIEIEVKEEI